jgi:hypothetical protein
MNRRLKLLIVSAGALAASILITSSYLVWTNRYRTQEGLEQGAIPKPHPFEPSAPRRLHELPEKFRTAADAVAAVLVRERADPREFRAVVSAESDSLVFHLWHISAFETKRKAAAQGYSVVGNPGGKCRDIVYHLSKRQASDSRFWQ